MRTSSFDSRWLILAALVLGLGALGSAVVWAEGDWKTVVGLVSLVVISESSLAIVFRHSLRLVFAVLRNATTALILVAAVLRIVIAADRGASPSWLLAVVGVLAVAVVVVVESWAWREQRDGLRLSVVCLTQALFVAASAFVVIANLEMPN